jgi:carbohydrate kinase (thermoresistant glucokinase family)
MQRDTKLIHDDTPQRIVVAGIAGSGKTTVGRALATRLGVEYIDGDSLHPQGNVEKMAAGIPLTDQDRWPWLEAVKAEISRPTGVVASCSCLRRSYRDMLRVAGSVRFVFLEVSRADAVRRAETRVDHFMAAGMVDSQIATLEMPDPDETDVLLLAAGGPLDSVVDEAEQGLESPSNRTHT